MTPAELTSLLHVVGALLTALIVAVANAAQLRAQARKAKAETEQIRAEVAAVKHEVTPNSGGSSHDRLIKRIDEVRNEVASVRALQEVQGDLIGVHIAESADDRRLLHRLVEAKL